MSSAIALNDLTIRFKNFTAVNSVNFQVQPGEIFGFLGPNGSGKTTIIKTLCGLLKPTSGSAQVFGMDSLKQAESVRRQVGYMSQNFSLYDDLTVRENLNFYAGIYGLSNGEKKARIAEVVELTKLQPYLDRRAGKLSGGMPAIGFFQMAAALGRYTGPTAGPEALAFVNGQRALLAKAGQG